MYSPKIKEDLIPRIYHMAKAKGVRMTKLVNEILERALNGGGELATEGFNSDGKRAPVSEENDGERGGTGR